MGLLFLRFAVAITALVQGYCYFFENRYDAIVEDIVGIAFVVSGVALAAGFMTPLASTVIVFLVAGTALLWIPPPMDSVFQTAPHTSLTVVIAISVTILGPGAYSMDAHLFGRRKIIIPRLPPTR